MNVGHFRGSHSPLTFHNVKNHGDRGAEGEPGGIAKNEEQKKTTHREAAVKCREPVVV